MKYIGKPKLFTFNRSSLPIDTGTVRQLEKGTTLKKSTAKQLLEMNLIEEVKHATKHKHTGSEHADSGD